MADFLELELLPSSAPLHRFISSIQPKYKRRYQLECPFGSKIICWDYMTFFAPCLSCNGYDSDDEILTKEQFVRYFEERCIPYDLTKTQSKDTIRNHLLRLGITIYVENKVLDEVVNRGEFCWWIYDMMKEKVWSWKTTTKAAEIE